MILARLGAYGAILCCLWFNATYAWSVGGSDVHRYGQVALALTIDCLKTGLLPAAAHLWGQRHRFRSALLVVLWIPAFAFSTFCGYAALTKNRTTSHVTTTADEQARTRAQTAYDEASHKLATAQAATEWTATAACTVLKTKAHRDFCANVNGITDTRTTAEATLSRIQPVQAQAELSVLTNVTGISPEVLLIALGLAPAILIELAASVGLYAIGPIRSPKPSQSLQEARPRSWRPSIVRPLETPPAKALEASPVAPPPATPPPQVWTFGATP